MGIPKIIHYCWFGEGTIPENDRKCIESWKKYCPDYEIIEWNETNYDVTQNTYMYEAYQAKRWGFVPDYARLDIIYRYGGIYLDTDVELIRSLDELLELNGFAGFEQGTKYLALGLGFGAKKGDPFIKELRDLYTTRSFMDIDGRVDLTPNPKITTEYLEQVYPKICLTQKGVLENGFTLFPTEYFCPMNYETGKTIITKNTFSIHHYHASWKTQEEKQEMMIYMRYVKCFGQFLGERIYQFVQTSKEHGIITAITKACKNIVRW